MAQSACHLLTTTHLFESGSKFRNLEKSSRVGGIVRNRLVFPLGSWEEMVVVFVVLVS